MYITCAMCPRLHMCTTTHPPLADAHSASARNTSCLPLALAASPQLEEKQVLDATRQKHGVVRSLFWVAPLTMRRKHILMWWHLQLFCSEQKPSCSSCPGWRVKVIATRLTRIWPNRHWALSSATWKLSSTELFSWINMNIVLTRILALNIISKTAGKCSNGRETTKYR